MTIFSQPYLQMVFFETFKAKSTAKTATTSTEKATLTTTVPSTTTATLFEATKSASEDPIIAKEDTNDLAYQSKAHALSSSSTRTSHLNRIYWTMFLFSLHFLFI